MTPVNRARLATIVAGAALLAAIVSVFLVLRARQLAARDLAYVPPAWEITEPAEPAVFTATATIAPPPVPPPPLPPEDVQLVFTAGGETYVALDGLVMPRYREPRLVDNTVKTAIGDIATRDLTADLRQLQRHGMIVDGTCHARVTGFAVVARLRLLRDEDPDEWTAAHVIDNGRPVLAARIEDCSGTFARDAKHAPIVAFDVTDTVLADKAPDRLRASPLVASAQDDWQQAEHDGNWYDALGATFNFRTFVHPRTGVTWVLVHVYRDQDCGQLGGNVLGLYRVDGDELATVIERGAGRESYDQLIDVDDDGEPELVSSSEWSSSIERMSGEGDVSLDVPEVTSLDCGC